MTDELRSLESEDLKFMTLAIELARSAQAWGDVPVGAVVVRDGVVIGRGSNRREADQDPTAHAEMLALREASKSVGSWRLDQCTIYVTLEPCAMCAGALVLSRIGRCVFGCHDPKAGFLGSLSDLSRSEKLNHRFPVTHGVESERCSVMLRDFFKKLRSSK